MRQRQQTPSHNGTKVGGPASNIAQREPGASQELSQHAAALGLISQSLQGQAKLIPSRPTTQLQTDPAKSAPEQGHRAGLLCPLLGASEKDLDGSGRLCGFGYLSHLISFPSF